MYPTVAMQIFVFVLLFTSGVHATSPERMEYEIAMSKCGTKNRIAIDKAHSDHNRRTSGSTSASGREHARQIRDRALRRAQSNHSKCRERATRLLVPGSNELSTTTKTTASQPTASSMSVTSAWNGQVVQVLSGDTFRVMRDGKAVTVRLKTVDAPELDQPWGDKAHGALSTLTLKQQVKVKPATIDENGRFVANVIIPSGHDVAAVLAANGLVWHWPQYGNDADVQRISTLAKGNAKGLWSEPDPIPPWQWK